MTDLRHVFQNWIKKKAKVDSPVRNFRKGTP